MAITAGWGKIKSGGRTSNFLKKANVTVIDNGDCNSSHGGMITGNMICAYDAIKSSCNGDSGGPLMCRQNDKLVMCGVVSWGRRGCLGAPVVYVRTTGAQFNALKNLMEIMAKVQFEKECSENFLFIQISLLFFLYFFDRNFAMIFVIIVRIVLF